jgi:hypothetical protein
MLLFIRARSDFAGGIALEWWYGFLRRLDLDLIVGLDFLDGREGWGRCSWDDVQGMRGSPFASKLSERTASHQSSTVSLSSTMGRVTRARLRGR